jgi:hypothetical protein
VHWELLFWSVIPVAIGIGYVAGLLDVAFLVRQHYKPIIPRDGVKPEQ